MQINNLEILSNDTYFRNLFLIEKKNHICIIPKIKKKLLLK